MFRWLKDWMDSRFDKSIDAILESPHSSLEDLIFARDYYVKKSKMDRDEKLKEIYKIIRTLKR